jgi:osmotically-inducible protein OsmY
MKAAITTVAVALCLAAPVRVAFSQTTTTAAAKDDHALGTRIEQSIHKDATLKKYKINVSVDKGVATLSGNVATEADRARAAALANVPGVTRVDNQILVDINAGHERVGTAGKVEEKTKEGAVKTKDTAAKAGEKTKDAAAKAGEKTKEGVSKTGEVITDGWITTRVKSKFVGEDVLKGSDIHVDTNDHVVTLSGTVPSAAARARAIEQAKEVEGVHRVVDKMAIGPKK